MSKAYNIKPCLDKASKASGYPVPDGFGARVVRESRKLMTDARKASETDLPFKNYIATHLDGLIAANRSELDRVTRIKETPAPAPEKVQETATATPEPSPAPAPEVATPAPEVATPAPEVATPAPETPAPAPPTFTPEAPATVESVGNAAPEVREAFNETVDDLDAEPEEDVRILQLLLQGESPEDIGRMLGTSEADVRRIAKVAAHRIWSSLKGATQEALESVDPELVSNMNAVVNAERVERGEEPLLRGAVQSHPEVMDRAMREMEAEPLLAEDLVSDYNGGKLNRVGETDEAILLIHRVKLTNARRTQQDRAAAADPGSKEKLAAMEAMVKITDDLQQVDLATRRMGQISGRAFRFRQSYMSRDFTLVEMQRTMNAINGNTLSAEDQMRMDAKVEELAKNYAAAEAAVAKKDAQRRDEEREAAYQKAFKEMEERIRQEAAGTRYDPAIVRIAEEIAQWFDRAAEDAKKRLRARRGQVNMGLDPTILKDIALIGAKYVSRGVADFAAWSADVVQYLKGIMTKEELDPYLEEAWEQAKEIETRKFSEIRKERKAPVKKAVSEEAVKSRLEKINERVTTRAGEGADVKELGHLARALALEHKRTGLYSYDKEGKSAKALVRRVHEDLVQSFPDLTVDEVQDLISGYGDLARLDNSDPDVVELRSMKQELQLESKLRDIEAGKPAKKSGRERAPLTTRAQELTKRVNKAIKSSNYVSEDPLTQLKSAKEMAKTRLENEINAMDLAIATGEPITRYRTKSYTDEEIEGIRKDRDAKKKEYDAMFPKEPISEEQQIALILAGLDRQIARMEKDLAEGKIYPDARKAKPISPAKERQARLDELRAQRDEMRALDAEMIEFRKEQALRGQLLEAQKGAREKAAKMHGPESEVVTALREELRVIREERRNSVEERLKRSLSSTERAIAKLKKELESGELAAPKTKAEGPTSPELDMKRQELLTLQELAEEFKDMNPEVQKRRETARLQDAIDRILNPPEKIQRTRYDVSEDPDIVALSEQLKALQDNPARRAAKATELAVKTGEKLRARIVEGNIKPEAKTGPTSEELEAARNYNKILGAVLKRLRDLDPEIQKARRMAQLEKLIDRIENPAPVTEKQVADVSEDPEVKALADKYAALKKARLEDPVRKLASWRARTISNINRINERVARGDVLPRKRTEFRPMDAESVKLRSELSKARLEFFRMQHTALLKQRDFFTKGVQETAHLINTTRAIMTSYDASMIGRQGLILGLLHPKAALQALLDTASTLKWDHDNALAWYTAVNQQIFARVNNLNGNYKKMGVFLVDPEETSLAKVEEAFQTRLIDWLSEKKLKGPWQVLRPGQAAIRGVQRSQWAFTTYMNLLRANVADIFIDASGGATRFESQVTDRQAMALGRMINTAAGRSAAFGGGETANAVFFAIKFVTSRFEWVTGYPLWKAMAADAKADKEGGSRHNSATKIVATQYAKWAIAMSAVQLLARMIIPEDEWEKDPTSSNFGKIPLGNTWIDPWAGLQQSFVLSARLIAGRSKSPVTGKVTEFSSEYGGTSGATVAGRFLRTKLSPAAALVWDKIAGEDLVGKPFTIVDQAGRMVSPLSINEITEAFQSEGMTVGAIAGFLAFLGFSASTLNPQQIQEQQRQYRREKELREREKNLKRRAKLLKARE